MPFFFFPSLTFHVSCRWKHAPACHKTKTANIVEEHDVYYSDAVLSRLKAYKTEPKSEDVESGDELSVSCRPAAFSLPFGR